MIEVLVTLFILSIGLLGVASLQFIGSFSNADALDRSQAVVITQQLAERLRASADLSATTNGMVVDNSYFDTNLYNFKNLSGCSGANPYKCYCLARPAAIPDCQNGVCSAAEFASADAYDMSCAMAATNPAANISLTCADNNVADADACSVGSRHRIIIAWPAQKWQNIDRALNPLCNADPNAEPQDCVTLDVTL
ncbi:pilus assembly protein PilV [Aliiglaciecola sp. CAU 1673]|uniref:pilus assembly protein PilV n=1 Tax=Aliiglaciecola sp. CAU 1673 TaxID=3032595 RepID=UPI0023D9DAE1|nr:pilus assembly protein PilV [Aliiglaciecola sp. CAU 1673]MDF2178226.1 pilus assembly protein PilV [Aliiglaciecola sp. CAU 1673]